MHMRTGTSMATLESPPPNLNSDEVLNMRIKEKKWLEGLHFKQHKG